MKKIFFLGNSYTYFNDMPLIFEKLVGGAGYDVKVDKVTKGGCILRRYLEKGDEWGDRFFSTFESGNWDYIILQEQSKRPAVEEDEFASAAHELCEFARSKGTEPVFYQTWPYRDKTEKLATTECSYVQFYQKLRDAYRRAAARERAALVPVGEVFYRISLHHPEIDLLLHDDFHPNIYGSYVAAVMFLFHFYGTDTPVNYRPDEITEEEADVIIKAIKETI